MKNILIILCLMTSSIALGSDLQDRKEYIKKMEQRISAEATERKKQSEAILGKNNVPINTHLPVIEDSSSASVRDERQVAQRAMALLIVAVKAEGLEQEIVEKLVEQYDLTKVLTAKESQFIKESKPSEFDKTQFIWRYESAWTLLWTLGYVEDLSPPTGICDVPAAVTFLQTRTSEQFIRDSNLRSEKEILDQADLIYRYHWAIVDARVNGLKIPADINGSVVYERHYALNWLIGYMNQDWDNVTTDT